jgi:hypothetical protein
MTGSRPCLPFRDVSDWATAPAVRPRPAHPRWSLGEGWATLHTSGGFVLAFQHVDNYQPPRWPDPAHPQQFHLDLEVEDLVQAQDDVLARGATLLDAGDGRRSWRVFADPAGHPFCLVRH